MFSHTTTTTTQQRAAFSTSWKRYYVDLLRKRANDVSVAPISQSSMTDPQSTLDDRLVKELEEATLLRRDDQQTSVNDVDVSEDAELHVVVPHPHSLPKCVKRLYKVGGIATDVTVQIFHERIVVTCSQLKGRIGHWLLCKATVTDALNPSKKYSWDTTHLLGGGRGDPLLTVYVKHITERIIQQHGSRSSSSSSDGKVESEPPSTALLGLSLDNTRCKEPAFFHTIVDLLAKTYAEAANTMI
jgi:hypothetical protein